MVSTLIGVRPLRDDVLVDLYDEGDTVFTIAGRRFFTPSDKDIVGSTHNNLDGKHPGIRPRWGVVLATTDAAEEAGVLVGYKVLLDTLKWTRGIMYSSETRRKFWRIPLEDILMVDENGLTEDEKFIIASKADKQYLIEKLDLLYEDE